MKQINSAARRQVRDGQLNSIQAAPRVKALVSSDTAEIPLWRRDLLIEEVNKSKCYDSTAIPPYNFHAAIL